MTPGATGARAVKPLAPIPLRIGVKRRLSRLNDPDAERAEAEFQRQRRAILARDDWRCRGADCGFASAQSERAPAGGLEVHHLDDDHHNNDPPNLATLCPFCHMVFTAGKRGGVFAASLGLLPQITQGELNLIHHAVLGMGRAVELLDTNNDAARKTGWRADDIPARARKALQEAQRGLNELVLAAEDALTRTLGDTLPDISDPATLYGVLQELPEAEYRERDRILAPIRLLPDMESFSAALDLWARSVWLRNYPPSTWERLIDSVGERLRSKAAA